MITKIFLAIFLFLNTGCLGATLPQYPGYGPKNVYYLSCEGDYLFGGIDYQRLQDEWYLPYTALRDAYENKGYDFVPCSHGNFFDIFKI